MTAVHRGPRVLILLLDEYDLMTWRQKWSADYELLIGVGESQTRPVEPKASSNSVGVWRLLPPDSARQIANWRFDGPESLREEVHRAWAEAIVPDVLPLWNEPHRLAYARAQFDAGEFAQAVQAYEELGQEP